MSDLFAPLREHEPVATLTPAEVRRAGERRRRRRTGSAVAAAAGAALVVVSVAAVVLDRGRGADSLPDPVQTPEVLDVIPADLDLADGLPRGLVTRGGGVAPQPCGHTSLLPSGADATVTAGYQSRGDLVARSLSAFPDEGTARAESVGLLSVLRDCNRSITGLGDHWTTDVRRTSFGDDGWLVARYPGADGDRRQPVEVVHVVRVDAHLLVVQQREIHGLTVDAMVRGSNDQVNWLLDRQLCLLAAEGCPWRSDPDVLGPLGWGPWRLGMSREEVTASGGVGAAGGAACAPVQLDEGVGTLSSSGALVAIEVPAGVSTPDGVGLGSTREEVEERYWFGERRADVLTARASPTTDYRFTFDDGRLTALALVTAGSGCDP